MCRFSPFFSTLAGLNASFTSVCNAAPVEIKYTPACISKKISKNRGAFLGPTPAFKVVELRRKLCKGVDFLKIDLLITPQILTKSF